jgi:hypothetical protein
MYDLIDCKKQSHDTTSSTEHQIYVFLNGTALPVCVLMWFCKLEIWLHHIYHIYKVYHMRLSYHSFEIYHWLLI